MAETIVVLLALGAILYIIKYSKLSPPPETFAVNDKAIVGNPYHSDYPKQITVVEVQNDSCLCRFENGQVKALKKSDLTKQSY